MNASAETKPATSHRPRLHLSTAVVVFLVACVYLGANLTPLEDSRGGVYVSEPDGSSLTDTWTRYQCGFPFQTCDVKVFGALPADYDWHRSGVLWNSLIGLLGLTGLTVVLERRIRRRTPLNPPSNEV